MEIWKDIPGYEGLYKVSSIGQIKSIKPYFRRKEYHKIVNRDKILNQHSYKDRYFRVSLHKNKKREVVTVHKLVAMAFLNHIPNGLEVVVDHINHNRQDNRIENLQLITHRKNLIKDRHRYNYKYEAGVTFIEIKNKYRAAITHNKRFITIGYFKTEEEASFHYNNAAKAIKDGKEIKKIKHNFSSKYNGVCWDKARNKWKCYFFINKNLKIHIGYYITESEAYKAREKYLTTRALI